MTSATETTALLEAVVTGDLEALPEIARRHGLLLIAVFGSTAKRRRHARSDLDLAVLFDRPMPDETWAGELAAVEASLEDALRPTGELDVAVLNRASPVLLKEVADHGAALYEDSPYRWTLFRISAYRRFEDTEKYRRRRLDQLIRKYRPEDAPTAAE
jgi:predicted nucleotidyltransferase